MKPKAPNNLEFKTVAVILLMGVEKADFQDPSDQELMVVVLEAVAM